MKISRCVHCGGTKLPKVDHVLPMKIAGQNFALANPMYVCATCNNAYLTPGVLDRFEKRAAVELARAGVHTAEAVRFMRKALGLRAKDFAELIGQTAENISRVENGKAPADLRTVSILGSLLEDQEKGTTATLEQLRALRTPRSKPRTIVVSLDPARKRRNGSRRHKGGQRPRTGAARRKHA